MLHLIPSHMRHLQLIILRIAQIAGEAHYSARQDGQSRNVAFLTVLKQHLQADTDTEKRLGLRRMQHRRAQSARLQFANTVWHRPLTRENHTRCLYNFLRIIGHHDRRSWRNGVQCLIHRAQIAHAIINYRNIYHSYT